MRLSTSHSIATAARDWNLPLLRDPELAWTFQIRTEDPGKLDEKEQARFIELCFSLLRMFEDAHYQYHHALWILMFGRDTRKLYAAYAKAPRFQAYWKERKETFRPEFQEFVDGHEPAVVATWGALKQQREYLRT